MNDSSKQTEAVEMLQQLGLKEYEARCFVALSRLPDGTAKEVSEVSDVPRTRVYDAIRVLESKGLVEVQHASPQRFRAVGVDEAVATLRQEYATRTEQLRETLGAMGAVSTDEGDGDDHEVWSLSGRKAITSRTAALLDDAGESVHLLLGDERLVTDDLLDRLQRAHDRGVEVVVETATTALCEEVAAALDGVDVGCLGEDVLAGPDSSGPHVGRVLFVDETALLVSSVDWTYDVVERAVVGDGVANGLVLLLRRLLTDGRLAAETRCD